MLFQPLPIDLLYPCLSRNSLVCPLGSSLSAPANAANHIHVAIVTVIVVQTSFTTADAIRTMKLAQVEGTDSYHKHETGCTGEGNMEDQRCGGSGPVIINAGQAKCTIRVMRTREEINIACGSPKARYQQCHQCAHKAQHLQ